MGSALRPAVPIRGVHALADNRGQTQVPAYDEPLPSRSNDAAKVSAQVRFPSGAPTTGESALTSGYLLVEARSPLTGVPRVSSR